MAVDQKLLLSHLSAKLYKAIERTFAATIRARNKEITIEHVFVALLDDNSTELSLLVDRYQLDVGQLRSQLSHAAGAGTLADKARPALSPALFQWLEEAWMLASLELGRQRIGSGIVFLKLIQQAEKYGGSLGDALGSIPVEYVKKDLRSIADVAQETGAETRWASADAKSLAEAVSSIAPGALPAAYEAAFAGLRDWLVSLSERGSGLSLAVDEDVWVLRAIGGAPQKRAEPPAQPPVAAEAPPPPAPPAPPAPSPPPAPAASRSPCRL